MSLPQLPNKKQGSSSEIANQISRMSKVVDGMLHDKEREKLRKKVKQNNEQLIGEAPKRVNTI